MPEPTELTEPTPTPRIVQVRQQVLKKNDVLARALRERYAEAGVFVVSLVSSPGAGKTTFLRETLRKLRDELGLRVAALVGDQVIPVGASHQLRALARAPTTMLAIEGAAHHDIHRHPGYLEPLAEHLVRAATR